MWCVVGYVCLSISVFVVSPSVLHVSLSVSDVIYVCFSVCMWCVFQYISMLVRCLLYTVMCAWNVVCSVSEDLSACLYVVCAFAFTCV